MKSFCCVTVAVLVCGMVSAVDQSTDEKGDKMVDDNQMDKRYYGFNSDLGKRYYGFNSDLGKRYYGFNSDLGKRYYGFNSDLGKRYYGFNSDLGKRYYGFNSDLGKRYYGFNSDLGKRSVDEDKQQLVKADEAQSHHVSKRHTDDVTRHHNDVKRALVGFGSESAKRHAYSTRLDFGKRHGNKRSLYNMDLGKRAVFLL